VWAVAWLPRDGGEPDGSEMLAVGTHVSDATHELRGGSNALGLWRVRPEAAAGGGGGGERWAELLHDGGGVLDLEWCPSGNAAAAAGGEGELGRMGLLAAACADGAIRVWALPRVADLVGLLSRGAQGPPLALAHGSISH